MSKRGKLALLAIMAAMLTATPAFADSLLEGAQACTRYFPKAERYHNIPTHWLAAIGSTESGRYHKRLGMTVPWPWTINVGGKGYYFDTKQEALDMAKSLYAKGITSFDVGCMQVNMHYHGNAFASLNQALEPRYNVAYAARFLRENFDELHSWKQATAAYHSKTPDKGDRYFKTVFGKWETVVSKLGKAMDAGELYAERPVIRKAEAKQYSRFQVNGELPKQQTVRMKTIKIADALESQQKQRVAEKSEFLKSRENGVLVTRTPVRPTSYDMQAQPVKYDQQSNNMAHYEPNVF